MIDRLEVTPGPGTAIRYGWVAAWASASASPALIRFLAESVRNLADSPAGGDELTDHLASVLSSRDPEPHVPFAVVGAGDQGWAGLLHGPIQVWDGTTWTTVPPHPGWLRCRLWPRPSLTVTVAGAPVPALTPDTPWDLRSGVVPGGGFVLYAASGAAAPPPPPIAVPLAAAPPPSGDPTSLLPPPPGAAPPPGVGGPPPATGPEPGPRAGAEPSLGVGADGTASTNGGGGPSLLQPEPQGGGRSVLEPETAHSGRPADVPPSVVGEDVAPPAAPENTPPPVVPEDSPAPPVVGAGDSAPPVAAAGESPSPAVAAGDVTGVLPRLEPDFERADPTTAMAATPAPPAGTGHWLDLRDPDITARLVPYPPLPPVGAPPRSGPGAPVVSGRACQRGHLNRPGATRCARCPAPVGPDATISGVRPGLGCLVADDGTVYRLDSGYVIGSDPGRDPAVRGGLARALALAGEGVADAHAEIRLVEWEVMLSDRRARAGTYVFSPERNAWERLGAGEQRTLRPGAHLALSGRILTYLSPWVPE